MQATSTPTPTPPQSAKNEATSSAPAQAAKTAETPVVWTHDLNLPTSGEMTWGFDPAGLQDG